MNIIHNTIAAACVPLTAVLFRLTGTATTTGDIICRSGKAVWTRSPKRF